jgi:regulator of protease activity HflC (stomatin/prohibitin superfamily)
MPLAFTAASAALVPAGDQDPLLLCQGRVEMKHEGVNVRAKLGDHERDWGIKVANVELKHVDLNERCVQSKQAEAERRAMVSDAEGESHAAEKLLQAGQVLAKAPEAMPAALPRHASQHRRREEFNDLRRI